MTSWTYLFLAGISEIGFTTFMKLSEGLKNWIYIPPFCIFAITGFVLLNKSLNEIPMGTAYAIWTGIGACGTAVVGIVFFKEPATPLRLVFLTTLISSIIGLKFLAPSVE